jgi:beta-galactosidase
MNRPPIWLDRARFAVQRQPGRAQLPTTLAPVALAGEDPPDRLRLDGSWQFEWRRDITGFDAARAAREPLESTDRLPVPSVWQLHGYGTPYYLANTYPPAVRKRGIPNIPDTTNEVGIYRRTFTVPEPWSVDPWAGGQRLLLFEGVKAGLELFVNGRFAGYSQGSFLPAEFDVTSLLVTGENEVTAVVYRYTDGTYLEDQDMWFLSGIFRPVWLIAEPAVAVTDVFVRGEVAPDLGSAGFRVTVTMANRRDMSVDAGVHVSAEGAQDLPGQDLTIPAGGVATVEQLVPAADPRLWSAEHPNLYDVRVRLTAPEQATTWKQLRTGLRRVEIVGDQLLINGRRLVFKGVNRHDFDPDHGWAVPEWRYRADLLEAKRLNINAIRTSHYPNPQLLYEVADELGLYVLDECDLETHGVRRRNVPGDDPAWTAAVVDRMERMVLADRNHPSVVMWSLGNEAGLGGADGGNFVRMRAAAVALDDTRPFHYEGDHDPRISDVVSRMYATPDQMAMLGRGEPLRFGPVTKIQNRTGLTDEKDLSPEQVAGRPVMLCEYAHCMENSLGNFGEYIDVFHRYPNQLGGFIWDYIDQSIRRIQPDGSTHWLYGGDFGDSPTHGYFCANGVLAADRSRHPAAAQVFWGYRNLVVTCLDAASGAFELTNRFLFTDSDEYDVTVEVRRDGTVVESITTAAPHVPPGQSRAWTLARVAEAVRPPGKHVIRIGFHQRGDSPWQPAGAEVAFDEFVVAPESGGRPPRPVVGRGGQFRISRGDRGLTARTGDTAVRFDGRSGELVSWSSGNHEVLAAPVRLNYWRALTDNDRGVIANLWPRTARFLVDTAWRTPKVSAWLTGDRVTDAGWSVSFALSGRLFRDGFLEYLVRPDGTVSVRHELTPRKDMIRFGLTLGLPGPEYVTWYGKGPVENYVDRNDGAWTAIHELPIAELGHDYMRPQENGNRTCVRWARFADATGELTATDLSGDWIGFSAWPYTQEQLDEAEHIHELRRGRAVTVNLDRQQRGVGGDLPGDAALHEPYRMPKGRRQSLHLQLSWRDCGENGTLRAPSPPESA